MLTRSLLLTAAAAALVSSQTEPAVERSNELFAEFGRDPTSTGLVGQYLLDNGYLAAFENSDAVAIGPESEVDCSLYPDGSFEYYFETCYDEYHMHWVNGVCRNGVKEEMNELHRCAMFANNPLDITGRRYCHTCETTDGKPWKTLCGSDEPDKEKACLVALSDGDELPDGGCAEQETTTYYHQCNSAQTSSYDRQEFYCDGTEKPYMEDDPYTVRCGVEWYYPFDSGEPVVFSSEHKYCLDCGEAIGVCSDDPDKGCVAHGMPPRGRKFTTTVAPETASDEAGAGEDQQQPVEVDADLVVDTVDGDALDTLDSVAATLVPPVDEGEGDIVDVVDIVDDTNVATTLAPPTGLGEEAVDEATTMPPPPPPPVDENEPAEGEEGSEIMPTRPAVEGVDSSSTPVEDSPSGAMYVGSALAGTVLVAASSMAATCLVLL